MLLQLNHQHTYKLRKITSHNVELQMVQYIMVVVLPQHKMVLHGYLDPNVMELILMVSSHNTTQKIM